MSTLNDLNKFIPPEKKIFDLVAQDERPLKIINAFENKSAAILKLPKYINTYVYVVKYLEEDISKYSCKPPEWLNVKLQEQKSLIEIDKNNLDYLDYNGLDYSLN